MFLAQARGTPQDRTMTGPIDEWQAVSASRCDGMDGQEMLKSFQLCGQSAACILANHSFDYSLAAVSEGISASFMVFHAGEANPLTIHWIDGR